MKRKKMNNSYKYIILVCLILFLLEFGLGALFVSRSRSSMRGILAERMIGISDTAAAMIDGDTLRDLTEEDVKEKNENYHKIYDFLEVFKDNNKFQYIYTVKQVGEKEYVFVVDEDPVDPADYGEEIVYTEALYKAALGTPSVDFAATEDEWGTYYSAFSPIKDSKGEIIGVIGIDFDSSWYENEMSKNNIYLVVVSAFSLIIGAAVALIFTSLVNRKFINLNKQLSSLSTDIDLLTNEISSEEYGNGQESISMYEENYQDIKGDEIEELGRKMHYMQTELKKYISLVHARAYMDTMTGVSNKTAYLEKVKEIDREIINKVANFTIVVFDINGLKRVNDDNGHECGDRFINNTATVIKNLFGSEHSYRIGGDEFISILTGDMNKPIEDIADDILKEIERFNDDVEEGDFKVSFSFGVATYNPNYDLEFRSVFKRADDEMYQFKARFYQQFGDRRKPTNL